VHTAPLKGRYYQVPPGLAALRAFSYFQPKKESCYEKETTKAFLKSALNGLLIVRVAWSMFFPPSGLSGRLDKLVLLQYGIAIRVSITCAI
jgi:hypothetical protein